MPFSSQTEAKQFLVTVITRKAEGDGQPLSDVDVRVLSFSVDEPGSAQGIPEERLIQDDSDFEERTSRLLESAYKRAEPEERKRIVEAIREVNKGDYYIAVIARPVLVQATRARDMALYVLIGIALTLIVVVYAIYR